MHVTLIRGLAACGLGLGALTLCGCDALNREDEMRAQVEECKAFLKDVKDAAGPADAKKVFEDHKPKLEKAKKTSDQATAWLSVSEEVRKDWKDCYDDARHTLDTFDGHLAIEFGQLHDGS